MCSNPIDILVYRFKQVIPIIIETLYSPIEYARLLQHVAQIDVGVQEVRIQCDGLLEVVDGQPDLALRIEHAAQIAPGHREIGARFNRLQIAALWFLQCVKRNFVLFSARTIHKK